MVGYMTSGHGPLHVPRGDEQLKPIKSGAVASRTNSKENDRAHARRCGLEETSCPRRQAAAEQGRRGTRARWCGNKGRAAPVVRHESERHQCRCARRRPAYCWGLQQVMSPLGSVSVGVFCQQQLQGRRCQQPSRCQDIRLLIPWKRKAMPNTKEITQ